MKRCEKCNIDLDIISNKCPLCNSEIEDIKNFDSSYPALIPIINKHLFRKILLLIVSLISITIITINYFLTPKIKWSIFVVLQLVASYRVFYNILSGRRKVIKLFLMLNIFVCGISLFWDIYTGYHAWSVNYVLPSLCISYGIFMLVIRLVNYYAFKESSSYIYLNICLEFLPMILLFFDKATPNILIYLSGLFGVINLLILLIFDGSHLKDDILKKLHI